EKRRTSVRSGPGAAPLFSLLPSSRHSQRTWLILDSPRDGLSVPHGKGRRHEPQLLSPWPRGELIFASVADDVPRWNHEGADRMRWQGTEWELGAGHHVLQVEVVVVAILGPDVGSGDHGFGVEDWSGRRCTGRD